MATTPMKSLVAMSERACTRFSMDVATMQQQVAAFSNGMAKLQQQVDALNKEADRKFGGYGVWETTAFYAAIFVATYAVVPNPTGVQGTRDLSEVRVFRQWLIAAITLLGYVLLVIGVLVDQLVKKWRGWDVFWLFAMMVLAPWAPVLDRVVRTGCATRRVCRMMRERGGRNRLTAMLREYLLLGHAGLSAAGVAYELGFTLEKPWMPDRASLESGFTGPWIKSSRRTGLPLSPAAILHTPDLSDLTEFPWYMLGSPLSFFWCKRADGGLADDPVRLNAVPSPLDVLEPTLSAYQKARIFDAIDEHLVCGTSSERRLGKLPALLCGRCRLAFRAAVEAYLESSSREHAVVDAPAWFRDASFLYSSQLETVLDVMWQAVIVDNGGNSINAYPLLGLHPTGPPRRQVSLGHKPERISTR